MKHLESDEKLRKLKKAYKNQAQSLDFFARYSVSDEE